MALISSLDSPGAWLRRLVLLPEGNMSLRESRRQGAGGSVLAVGGGVGPCPRGISSEISRDLQLHP